jgi:hypothetical protein
VCTSLLSLALAAYTFANIYSDALPPAALGTQFLILAALRLMLSAAADIKKAKVRSVPHHAYVMLLKGV